MPTAPDELRIHPDVSDDLENIKQHNPDHAKRCLDAITDWERQVRWGRVPQKHLRYLTTGGDRDFYRQQVGVDGYRVIYEISDDVMTAIAVLPRTDDTYDLDELRRRVDRL